MEVIEKGRTWTIERGAICLRGWEVTRKRGEVGVCYLEKMGNLWVQVSGRWANPNLYPHPHQPVPVTCMSYITCDFSAMGSCCTSWSTLWKGRGLRGRSSSCRCCKGMMDMANIAEQEVEGVHQLQMYCRRLLQVKPQLHAQIWRWDLPRNREEFGRCGMPTCSKGWDTNSIRIKLRLQSACVHGTGWLNSLNSSGSTCNESCVRAGVKWWNRSAMGCSLLTVRTAAQISSCISIRMCPWRLTAPGGVCRSRSGQDSCPEPVMALWHMSHELHCAFAQNCLGEDLKDKVGQWGWLV